MIIELANRDSDVGHRLVDQAFVGEARPTQRFGSPAHYETSATAKEYESISRHPYVGAGKLWPPLNSSDPRADDPARWKQFIAAFPWFPGVDDAYYRLSFRLLQSQDYGNLENTLLEYSEKDLPDQDAAKFIDGVLQRYLEASGTIRSPILQQLRVVVTRSIVRSVLEGSGNALEEISKAAQYLLSRGQEANKLGVPDDKLRRLASLAQKLMLVPQSELGGVSRT